MKKDLTAPMTASVAQNEKLEAFTRLLEDVAKKHPEAVVDIPTEHHIHAGCYSRTIFVKAGTWVAGLQIQVATQLVFCGKGQFSDGKNVKELDGYVVMEGAPKRRAAFHAEKDTYMTMFYASKKRTVSGAEKEFCAEPERLFTNRKEKLLCRELH